MTVDELFELMKVGEAPPLLDVRTSEERQVACLEPSLFLPLHELSSRIEELRPLQEKPFVVYCHHGVRSAYAVNWLQQMGFSYAINLEGGIDAWSIAIDSSVPRY